MKITDAEQELLARHVSSEVTSPIKGSLRAALIELLAIRQSELPWHRKVAKAFLTVAKSKTAWKIWKIYDRHLGRTHSVIVGVSYGDRIFIFLFESVQAILWIIFFDGGKFAEMLAERLADANTGSKS
ncbi:hypothetical protein OIU34_37615 [Pararhizobium sp. BT-229]|uniref:hypothetical protein n=1 Tax=Pararhizobium sp. BT-229 TaxID=2986923 RepID=UPI0021F6B780|nr:hypothetical protein [Pararhizobium sp. BT-229]MCV9967547.1 hypothetical protein [Pararhizobium sp. BT-229]